MAKQIVVSESELTEVMINRLASGAVEIIMQGPALDTGGDTVKIVVESLDWLSLPPNVQNTGNNFLKHLSREFNNLVADEDSETWIEP